MRIDREIFQRDAAQRSALALLLEPEASSDGDADGDKNKPTSSSKKAKRRKAGAQKGSSSASSSSASSSSSSSSSSNKATAAKPYPFEDTVARSLSQHVISELMISERMGGEDALMTVVRNSTWAPSEARGNVVQMPPCNKTAPMHSTSKQRPLATLMQYQGLHDTHNTLVSRLVPAMLESIHKAFTAAAPGLLPWGDRFHNFVVACQLDVSSTKRLARFSLGNRLHHLCVTALGTRAPTNQLWQYFGKHSVDLGATPPFARHVAAFASRQRSSRKRAVAAARVEGKPILPEDSGSVHQSQSGGTVEAPKLDIAASPLEQVARLEEVQSQWEAEAR